MFTPCQKIKRQILEYAYQRMDLLHFNLKDEKGKRIRFEDITPKNVDYIYSRLYDIDTDFVREAEDDFRNTGVETNIEPEWSRLYSSKSMARRLTDGSWIGFTYFYGGGKHGEPEGVAWMEQAYDLAVEEKEVVRTERIFTKINNLKLK